MFWCLRHLKYSIGYELANPLPQSDPDMLIIELLITLSESFLRKKGFDS